MFVFSAIDADRSTISIVLLTVALSPVKLPSSVLKVLDNNLTILASAGTRSPTVSFITSPGTSSDALRLYSMRPSRNTLAYVG